MTKQVIVFFCLLSLLTLNTFAAETVVDPFTEIAATVQLKDKEKTIYMADFQNAIYDKVRSSYYHGKTPEGEEQKVRGEVWDTMINETILWLDYENAALNSLDQVSIDIEVAKYDDKYTDDKRWDSMRNKVLPIMVRRLTRNKIGELMKVRFEDTVTINEQEAKSFYLKNPQLFTEPESVRASIILFSVDPSSSTAVWDLVVERAKEIKADIHSPEDFATSAREYSTDFTAEKGGDMGYLHKGQIGGQAQEATDKLAVGEISDPVILLEGMALFMVTERLGATHHTFEEVAIRASGLALRDKKEKDWAKHLERLKLEAVITKKIVIDSPTAS